MQYFFNNSCNLFNGISDEKINKLFSEIFCKEKTFEQGEIIAYQDETADSLMIILGGTVRGEMVDYSGKTIIIEEMQPFTVLASAFIFGKKNKFPVNIVAQETSKILIIPKDSLLKLLYKDENILKNLLNIISNRAQFLTYKIKFLSFHSIKGKFAFYILDLAKNNNSNSIKLPITQNRLADLFGVTRPSLARAIREMHNDKIIFAKGKSIDILNTYELYDVMK
jgi:CRP/FNR family transcriptional regulator, dissimilatory nitrate respiration regulator